VKNNVVVEPMAKKNTSRILTHMLPPVSHAINNAAQLQKHSLVLF